MKWSGGEAYMLHVTYMFRRKMLTCYMLHVGQGPSLRLRNSFIDVGKICLTEEEREGNTGRG